MNIPAAWDGDPTLPKALATITRRTNEVVPQMWVYEQGASRAFVSLQGHYYTSFSLPHYRGLLLRGIAWAGKRDVDLLTVPEERARFRYPEGGPASPADALKKIKVPPDFDIAIKRDVASGSFASSTAKVAGSRLSMK